MGIGCQQDTLAAAHWPLRPRAIPTALAASWLTPAATLPSPYDNPSICVNPDSGGSNEALLEVYRTISCKLQTTLYRSAIAPDSDVDCMGLPPSGIECPVRQLSLGSPPWLLPGHDSHDAADDVILVPCTCAGATLVLTLRQLGNKG